MKTDLDPTRKLAAAKFGTLNKHFMHPAEAITIVDEPKAKGEITAAMAEQLWAGGKIVYAEDALPTPVEKPEQSAERLVEMEVLADGRFMIRAPWLAEAVFETDEQKAAQRRDEAVAEGVALYTTTAAIAGPDAAAGALGGTDGFAINPVGGGYYEITGPGLAEPERVRGQENADNRLAELRGEAATGAEG